MKSKEIVVAELAALLRAYFEKNVGEIDFEMMADALDDLAGMYRRKRITEDLKKNMKNG